MKEEKSRLWEEERIGERREERRGNEERERERERCLR